MTTNTLRNADSAALEIGIEGERRDREQVANRRRNGKTGRWEG